MHLGEGGRRSESCFHPQPPGLPIYSLKLGQEKSLYYRNLVLLPPRERKFPQTTLAQVRIPLETWVQTVALLPLSRRCAVGSGGHILILQELTESSFAASLLLEAHWSQSGFFAEFLFLKKSWSKRKQAFGPQGATMDTHMNSLSAWAWRLLCDMLSARDSRDGVGTPPGAGHGDAADFSVDLVRIFV